MRACKQIGVAVLAVAALAGSLAAQAGDRNAELFKVRESVWRAWFANDRAVLEQLVPAETIVISAGEREWKGRAKVVESAAQFQVAGGKLVQLEFPRTEVQRFGDVAVLYSQYFLETEMNGKRSQTSGRVTEIFVFRDGKWTNPGWHTDAEQ